MPSRARGGATPCQNSSTEHPCDPHDAPGRPLPMRRVSQHSDRRPSQRRPRDRDLFAQLGQLDRMQAVVAFESFVDGLPLYLCALL
jgi:hypothetical protein